MKMNGLFPTIQEIWKNEKIFGFYRGAAYPLVGSIIFRSL